MVPEEIASKPVLPDHGRYLWDIFLELHADREDTGFGPKRISSRDIFYWMELPGNHILKPWEIQAIRAMDQSFLKVQAEVAKRARNK